METIDDDLRQRLFDHMAETGVSLNRLARRAGVTQSSLYRFMFNFSRKRPSKQAKLARYLDLSLSESSGQKHSPK